MTPAIVLRYATAQFMFVDGTDNVQGVGSSIYAQAHSHPAARTVVIIARVPLIVADLLLIYITWTKLSSRDVLKGIRTSKRLSLSDIFLRDGTLLCGHLFCARSLDTTQSPLPYQP